MNVLVINAGSSSLKYQLIDLSTQEVYAKGNCERIGIEGSFLTHSEHGGETQRTPVPFPTHREASEYVLELITNLGHTIDGIGHRVVQGGWYFPESAVVDDEVLAKVREVAPLAPLHNYVEADVIEAMRKAMPEVGNVVVCDTSFHYHMPETSWRYALPRDVVDRLHIRKYGAHGTSHRFIWRATREFTHGETKKLISLHLGSGSSLCAIEDGRSMDTTMGLTPLDGLIMGTRTGTVDPATVFYLQRVGNYTVDEVDTMMNKQSGLLALSGISSDTRDIEDGAAKGDEHCIIALEMFGYRTAQLTLEMAQAMEGFDTMAFSAGIGENSPLCREKICERLAWQGVRIDKEKNAVRSGEVRDITGEGSKVRVLVVPTNEELMIAYDVQELLG